MLAKPRQFAALYSRLGVWLRLALLAGLMTLAALPAQAASYTFPGNLPAGCSGSAGTYNCSALTLGYGDTVTIASPKPATINVSGAMSTNTSSINSGGAASDLTLNVSGALTLGYQAVVNAQISAASVSDANGSVTLGGSVTATGGAIALFNATTVAGSLSATGAITVGQNGVVSGSVTSSNGSVTVGNGGRVTGAISAKNDVTLVQGAVASSSIDSSTGNLDIGYAARVTGNATATLGTIALAQSAIASACVRASKPNTITLGYQSTVTGVCCGGSCSNSCVTNNSTYSMPPSCAATLVGEYRFEETGWSGTTDELRDTAGYAGGPYDGKAQGSGLPTVGSASPARSGDPGTCGYATLPGPTNGGGNFVISGLPVSTSAGAKTSVSFWMYWDGSNSPIPIGWNTYVVELTSSYFGFNSANSDLYATSSTSLPNGWHHVVAVFTNGSVSGNKLYIDGAVKSLSQVTGSPSAAQAVVSSTLTIGGFGSGTGFRFSGRLDEVRVYDGELTATEVTTDYNRTRPCSTLVAQYRFEESSWAGTAGELKDSAGYASGPYNGKAQGSPLPTPVTASPALANNPGTCGYATLPGPTNNGGAFVVTSLPVSTTSGDQTTLAFWMYWDGTDNVIPVSWNTYDLWLNNGSFGFNTTSTDIYGIASTGLANGWHHVVAVFTNGSVTGNRLYIDGAVQTLTQRSGSPTLAKAVASGTLQIGGYGVSGSGFRFSGRLDEVQVYNDAVSAATVATLYAQKHACAATLLAEYKFEQASWAGTTGEVLDTSGSGYNATAASLSSTKPTTANSSPAASSSPGTCRYAAFTRANKDYVALPATFPNLGSASSFTVTAWFRTTDRTQTGQRIFIDDENGYLSTSVGFLLSLGDRGAGVLNFKTRAANTTELVTPAVIANNTWYFVAFGTDFGAKQKFLSVYDASGTLVSSVTNTYTATSIGSDSGITTIGGESNAAGGSENNNTYGFSGNIDEVRVYTGALTSTELAAVQALRSTCASQIDHLEIQHSSGSGLTCTPSTVTVRACQDAACTTLYTGGVTGTLTATGTGMTVNWPTGAAFSIGSGSSSVTEDLQLTTTGSVVLGTASTTPAPTNATTCNFGSPSCTFTAADAGLIFDVPNHRAESSTTFTVTAVKKADNSATCVPAFASVSKAVNFKCTYTNPTSGTQAVRVGGTALNSGNAAAAACDSGGAAVTLTFNSSGTASTTLLYADVGRVTLSASYTGSGSDAGLAMTGSDVFTVAPWDFAISGIPASSIAAGSPFTATVRARNYAGNTTPNFGRETAPEGATLGFVRSLPVGSAAVTGSFSGSTGSFTSGAATASNLTYAEVGQGNVSAVLTSGSYLGSGLTLAGSSEGDLVWCANEGGTCVLPTGATVTMYYQAWGKGIANVVSGMSGTVGCNNTTFGDPLPGWGKGCVYAATAGVRAYATAAATFKPHHFDVTATPACSSSFSYAGQPFATRVTARNAGNATTVNYDGSANTSPNFAKLTTLVDAPVLGLGSWSNNSIAVSAFAIGVANATPSYAFTSKTTAPQSLVVRASDADAVSSLGFAEPTMPLRSGRLTISNAFGSEKATLAVPVQAQYWSGLAWVQNTADSCTSVPAAAVVRAAYRDGKGAASTAWTSSASAISISAGAGTLTLGAPSPTMTGSLDFALNLGAATTDQSCLAAHPTSTAGGLAWLRSQNGACSTAWDRDPSARASFGIYTPETRKTIHVRELF